MNGMANHNRSDNTFYVGGGAAKTPEQVKVLKSKYENFDINIIKEIFKDVLNANIDKIVKPNIVGLPHVTYFVEADGKHYCFRSNLGSDAPETELIIEKIASNLAAKHGIPTNHILYVDCSRKKYKFDFQIQERLFGENPEHNFKGNKDDYDKISFELGQIIAKLSEIKTEGYGRFDKKIAAKENRLLGMTDSNYNYILTELESQLETILKAGHLTKDQHQKILKLFQDSKDLVTVESGSLVHYDLADHNLLYNPKTFKIVGIFDWEAVCSSDPMLDLGSAPTWKPLYERESKLIEGYRSIKALPDNFRAKINIYRLRTIIWKVVHNIKFDMLSPERLVRLEKALEPFKI